MPDLTPLWGMLAVLAGGAAWLARALWKARRAGEDRARLKGLEDAAKRTEAGRQAVQRGRAGGGTPDERLRDNDGRW